MCDITSGCLANRNCERTLLAIMVASEDSGQSCLLSVFLLVCEQGTLAVGLAGRGPGYLLLLPREVRELLQLKVRLHLAGVIFSHAD